jgi:hypothetical protein
MDALTVAFITACTTLIASVASPMVSMFVARQQIRASLISNNRERWVEALRDCVAEYVGLLLSLALVKQTTGAGQSLAIGTDGALLQAAERIVLAKNKIMLMLNPSKSSHAELRDAVEASYLALVSDEPASLTKLRADTETITRAGRAVLRAEWERVKRGD